MARMAFTRMTTTLARHFSAFVMAGLLVGAAPRPCMAQPQEFFTLTVSSNGLPGSTSVNPQGISCGSFCYRFPAGATVEVQAYGCYGQSCIGFLTSFARWSGACTGGGSCYVTMTSNQAVTAHFRYVGGSGSYPLTVTKSGSGSGTVTSVPAGINCGPTCTRNLSGEITLTAVAAEGSSFVGWTGAGCSGTVFCSVVMDGGRNVTATFSTGVTDTWRRLGPPPLNLPAVGVVNGVLHAVNSLSTEAYDPASNTWTTKAPMPTSRGEIGVGVVNGVLYAVGGRNSGGPYLATVEAYDPASNTWTAKAPMPTARAGLAVEVVNGVLYAVGGWGEARTLGTVEAYEPATNTWTAKAPMPTARPDFGVGVVNGVLLAIGGSGTVDFRTVPLGTVEAYDPATNTWTTRAPMPIARRGLGVGVVNGALYAFGGYVEMPGGFDDQRGATVEVYDPATDTWTAEGPMRTARSGLAVGVVNDVLHAFGGYAGYLATVEAYDPATNRWTPKAPMPTARYGL